MNAMQAQQANNQAALQVQQADIQAANQTAILFQHSVLQKNQSAINHSHYMKDHYSNNSKYYIRGFGQQIDMPAFHSWQLSRLACRASTTAFFIAAQSTNCQAYIDQLNLNIVYSFSIIIFQFNQVFKEKNPSRLRTRSLPSKQTKRQVKCFYFFQNGYCLFGSLCRFSHERPKYVEKIVVKQWSESQKINWLPHALEVDILKEPRRKLEQFRNQIRKKEREAWKSEIRENVRKGVGVMQATKYARQFMSLAKLLSPHAGEHACQNVYEQIQYGLQTGVLISETFQDSLNSTKINGKIKKKWRRRVMGDKQLIKLIKNKINDFTYPRSGVLLCMYIAFLSKSLLKI